MIGSGPAGTAVAAALIKQGTDVTIVDAGIEMPTAIKERANQFHRASTNDWAGHWQQLSVAANAKKSGGIPLKTVQGSTFPYDEATENIGLDPASTALRPSYARGGLSNVWGGSILPFQKKHISDWPLATQDLNPFYRNLFDFLPIAGTSDRLADDFPLFSDKVLPLLLSRQANDKLTRWERNSKEICGHGLQFGQARLALNSSATGLNTKGCAYCGKCLTGCPLDLVYRTPHTFENWVSEGKVKLEHARIETIDSSESQATARGKTSTGESYTWKGDRIFVAAGVLSTTKIICDSLLTKDKVLPIIDSYYFILPLLDLGKVSHREGDHHHALCQIFFELDQLRDMQFGAHLQLYSYTQLYADSLNFPLGLLDKLAKRLGKPLLNRLWVAQGYFHSSDSPKGSLSYKISTSKKPQSSLNFADETTKDLKAQVKSVAEVFKKLRKQLGFQPLTQLTQYGGFGRGFHSGGTMPMRDQPGDFETDYLGRPNGMSRVHVVDSSILPSIPPTTITLGVMANANRIAMQSRDL